MSFDTNTLPVVPQPDYSIGQSVGERIKIFSQERNDEFSPNRNVLMENRQIFRDRLQPYFPGLRSIYREELQQEAVVSTVEPVSLLPETSATSQSFVEPLGKVALIKNFVGC